MARGKRKMAENSDTDQDTNLDIDGIEEGRLPPSDISTLAETDLDNLITEELLTLIEDALDRLPVEELATIRDAAEAKRLDQLEVAKNMIVEEMRERLEKLSLSPGATHEGSWPYL